MHSVEALLPDQAMPDQATSDHAMSEIQASLQLDGRVIFPRAQKGTKWGRKHWHFFNYWLEHSYEPTTRELQLTGPETRALWLNRDFLKLQDGILFYSCANLEGRSDCLVVPLKLRTRVLYYSHNSKGSGHLGQKKTLDRLK